MLLALLVAGPSGVPTAACGSLLALTLPQTSVTLAEPVESERLPPHCRVAATVRPAADSEIRIEIWMPASGWNGKFLAVGNGAWGGTIPVRDMAAGVRRGYATAGTDTGHAGVSAAFAMGHPAKLVDFAERALHETSMKGKAIAAAYYGSAPRLSYFTGCSTGGRQALTEAQRFPADFDGIVAGSPGNYTTRQAFGQVWIAQSAQKHNASRIPAAKLALIHDAAIAACDASDGVKDGVLEDPTRCAFDPAVLLCRDAGADSAAAGEASCLTAPQVDAVKNIYAGAKHPRTGEQIFPGLERGGELGWERWWGGQPAEYATDFFKYIVYGDSSWDFRTLNFDGDLATAARAGAVLDAIDPNLGAFAGRGGRLLLYAGWSDPGIAPRNVVTYYERVRSTLGERSARDAVRLFMVPGMAHCGGGDGTATFDMLAALETWVEHKTAPAAIPASRAPNGVVDRTRPLCPYPQVASYKGGGSIDDAGNFVCR